MPDLPPSPHLMFVEDDDSLRFATTQALELAGLSVEAFDRAEPALARLSHAFDGAIVSDIRLPGMEGLEFLAAVRAIDPGIPLILVTGHGDVRMAVSALKSGAYDFLTKPFATDHLIASVRRALDHRALEVENRRLRNALEVNDPRSPLVGISPEMGRLRSAIRQLAAADCDVLVEGETGVGKEVVAALLHSLGPRVGRPFVAINCAALSEEGFERELFGHSADTLAYSRSARRGLITASSGGTLLLDEIDSLAVPLQARLLRVLEEREVQPLGAARPEPLKLRVIATSKINLFEATSAGQFRADLYYRLALTRLHVPPLRERGDDIPLLFQLFVEEAREQFGIGDFYLAPGEMLRLRTKDWPGNVRELRNHAFSLVLGHGAVTPTIVSGQKPTNFRDRVAAFEAEALTEAIMASGGNVGHAISLLGLPRKTFYDKVAKLNLPLSILRGKKDTN